MANPTQPILCCLGEQVAGSPTQFVIDRMLSAADLDWRVFTTEINPEDTEAAVLGVSALRFSALRVAHGNESTARIVREKLLSQNVWLPFLSECNSAGFEAKWVGWNSESAGLLWMLRQVACPTLSSITVLMHGDSSLTRNLFHAYHFCRLSDQIDECTLHWIGLDEEHFQPPATDSLKPFQLHRTVESYLEKTAEGRRESASGAQQAVLLVGESTQEVQEIRSHVGDLAGDRLLCCSGLQWEQAAKSGRILHYESNESDLPWVSPIDLASSALAHDFERWTGAKAHFQMIREAYEEFCEF
ncbi:MAG: hypothetical protein ACE361_12490 [Aureliella sp.]